MKQSRCSALIYWGRAVGEKVSDPELRIQLIVSIIKVKQIWGQVYFLGI